MNDFLFTINSFSFKHFLSNSALTYNGNAYVPEKGCTLICGASGIGKSTLINILCGIIPKYYPGKFEGSIVHKKMNILDNYPNSLTAEIGYIFQNPYAQIVAPYVANEIVFSLENHRIDHYKSMKQYAEAVEYFDIADILERSTQFLSGGEYQKVILASILASKPKILVFDEPTSFLDPQQRDYLYEQIALLKKNHTVVLIDHMLEKALIHADNIIYINTDRTISMAKKESVGALLNSKDDDLASALRIKKNTEQKNFHSNVVCINNDKDKQNQPDLMKNNLCVCDSVSFLYGKKSLFSDVSLRIDSGEIISVVGKNGSGKTTLLKLLSGLLKPSSGRIYYKINGITKSPKLFSDFGCIQFQNSESMFFFKTVVDELKNEIKQRNATMSEIIRKYSSFFPIEKYKNKSPFALSEGEKRRLCFLLCLIAEKHIILYDEPTFGQDGETLVLMEQTLFKMKQLHKMQIVVTHDIDFARRISDEIYTLKDSGLHAGSQKHCL